MFFTCLGQLGTVFENYSTFRDSMWDLAQARNVTDLAASMRSCFHMASRNRLLPPRSSAVGLAVAAQGLVSGFAPLSSLDVELH